MQSILPLELKGLTNKVLMSQGWSWVSVKNCPDSHLELPTFTHSHLGENNNNKIQNDLFKNETIHDQFYIFGTYSAQKLI